MKTKEIVTCPKCNKDYTVSVWRRLNTLEHPKCKSQLLNDTLFKHKCPHCSAEIYVYHDLIVEFEEKSLLIFNSMNSTFDAHGQRIEKSKLKPEYQRFQHVRVVDSPDALKEKMRMFDMDKDDHIIELIKLSFLNVLHEKNITSSIKDVLCWIENDGQMTFDFFGQKNGSLRADKDLYDLFYQKYYDQLTEMDMNDVYINLDWAIGFLECIEEPIN